MIEKTKVKHANFDSNDQYRIDMNKIMLAHGIIGKNYNMKCI